MYHTPSSVFFPLHHRIDFVIYVSVLQPSLPQNAYFIWASTHRSEYLNLCTIYININTTYILKILVSVWHFRTLIWFYKILSHLTFTRFSPNNSSLSENRPTPSPHHKVRNRLKIRFGSRPMKKHPVSQDSHSFETPGTDSVANSNETSNQHVSQKHPKTLFPFRQDQTCHFYLTAKDMPKISVTPHNPPSRHDSTGTLSFQLSFQLELALVSIAVAVRDFNKVLSFRCAGFVEGSSDAPAGPKKNIKKCSS